jgi:DNA-directed RNA polymerase sigma subunit (sigma70/sigma32)
MAKPLNGAAYVRWLHAQVKRRAEIKALHGKGISLAEIGRRLGITRERVRQIVRTN